MQKQRKAALAALGIDDFTLYKMKKRSADTDPRSADIDSILDAGPQGPGM